MEFLLAASHTKPGSKANSRGRSSRSGGKPARVPVGVLHYVDAENQASNASMYSAICGEANLIGLPDDTAEDLPNELCPICADQQWSVEFNEMQKQLLK